MGKRQVHVIVVRKPVTIALLILATAAIVALLWFLSGKAYAADAHPGRELLARLLGRSRGTLSTGTAVAFLMPVIAHVLLFVPWGFLAFVALDTPSRKRIVSYAVTFLAALVLAALIWAWQQYLPTRVTTLQDTLSNACGALAGAALGHARKSVRVRFAF